MRTLFAVILALNSFFVYPQKEKTKDPEKEKNTRGSGSIFKDHTPHARDFHSIGHSLFFDLNLGPLKSYQNIENYDTLTQFSRIAEYSLYHLSYFLRFNIAQPDDDHAFSIAFNPGIGIGQAQSKKVQGAGMFSMGLLLGWESGAGSTYKNADEKGWVIRLGAEYTYLPLITSKRTAGENDIRSWVSPVVSFGFRKENRKQNLVETNFKIGWGFPRINSYDASAAYTFVRPFTFRMSFVVFLDH